MPRSRISLALPSKHLAAVDPSAHAVAGIAANPQPRERKLARLGTLDDRLAQRMLGATLERGREAQHLGLVVAGVTTTSVSAGSPR